MARPGHALHGTIGHTAKVSTNTNGFVYIGHFPMDVCKPSRFINYVFVLLKEEEDRNWKKKRRIIVYCCAVANNDCDRWFSIACDLHVRIFFECIRAQIDSATSRTLYNCKRTEKHFFGFIDEVFNATHYLKCICKVYASACLDLFACRLYGLNVCVCALCTGKPI